MDKLLEQLVSQLAFAGERQIETIFMGGGTPSLFSGLAITELLSGIASKVNLSQHAEITIEANPGATDRKNLQAYLLAGVNRLSVGVQSFQDQCLRQLGRIHSGDDALAMISSAKQSGFSNFNIDLMHGLPGQSLEQAMADLEQAISLHPTHISWYQLTIEPNTRFYKYPPELPEEDALWSIQEAGHEFLQKSGYVQYEVSAYALPDNECQHNLNYWRFGDYLGIGAGAHGKISRESGSILRSVTKKMPREYLQSVIPCSYKEVPDGELVSEFLLNALRLKDGFEAELFSARTGLPLSHLDAFITEARGKGLLQFKDRIRPSDLGYRHLNDLLLMVI